MSFSDSDIDIFFRELERLVVYVRLETLPEAPDRLIGEDIQLAESPMEIIEKINGVNISNYYSHIENSHKRFKNSVKSDLQKVTSRYDRKTYLLGIYHKLEEVSQFFHTTKKERTITVTHDHPQRIIYSHDYVKVYLNNPDGTTEIKPISRSESEIFSEFIKTQFQFLKRSIRYMQTLLKNIEEKEAKVIIEDSRKYDSEDERIVTNLTQDEIREYFELLKQKNRISKEHPNQPIMNKGDIEHLIRANFKEFDEPREIKKLSPNCTQADLLHFVYKFYVLTKTNKREFARFLIKNFTQFDHYDVTDPRDVNNVYQNMKSKPPGKHPISYV